MAAKIIWKFIYKYYDFDLLIYIIARILLYNMGKMCKCEAACHLMEWKMLYASFYLNILQDNLLFSVEKLVSYYNKILTNTIFIF